MRTLTTETRQESVVDVGVVIAAITDLYSVLNKTSHPVRVIMA